MLKEKTNRKRLIWKIGNGIIIGLLAILFISYLYSPVHTKFNKKVDGEYLRYETEEHEAELHSEARLMKHVGTAQFQIK